MSVFFFVFIRENGKCIDVKQKLKQTLQGSWICGDFRCKILMAARNKIIHFHPARVGMNLSVSFEEKEVRFWS